MLVGPEARQAVAEFSLVRWTLGEVSVDVRLSVFDGVSSLVGYKSCARWRLVARRVWR